MAATLENIGQLERRVNLTLAPAEIDGEIQTRLKTLARKAKMPGFRPGKVPFKVVQQQYEAQVRSEVLGDALQKEFGEVVREQNLRVAGYPRFENGSAAVPLSFSATFEVYPEVTPGDISQATLHRIDTPVTDAEVDHTLDVMRKQRARFNPVERAARRGDRVTLDFDGTLGGEPFNGGSGRDMTAVLGEGQLLPDFESQMEGVAAGGDKTFDLRFPDDYQGREVAGKTGTFKVHIKEVAEPELPAVDAEFARSLGIADGDIGRMRAEIHANLEREVKGRVQARLREQVMQALLDATPVEVPKSLVEFEVQRLESGARADMESRGMKTAGLSFPRDVFEPQARRRVQLGLILSELVQRHGLQAKPEQVRQRAEERAQNYEDPQQVVKWIYQSPERLREIESAVAEDNVLEWALGNAKVENKTIEFKELMGQVQ